MADIFISRPTVIDDGYEKPYRAFEKFIKSEGISPRRIGKSDYSLKAPLVAVMKLMEQCKGAIILGYPHHEVVYCLTKGGEVINEHGLFLPTPWNQIEGTLAYKKEIPVLVIAQEGVEGGLFDYGVTGQFVHKTDLSNDKWFESEEFLGIFQDWEKQI
ncbi:MAG TPA: hypothetical protein ENH62_09340 [Marinobacter sp.]|uniref:Uncharacterized protein n=1 Tax=marine sediment metagenome TaxID=412755 RepID=A0A0F9FVA4_9ZZZZ|nr:hypothetical protein [Marinobacter sp.]